MNNNDLVVDSLIATAASMRAAGENWNAIANAVDRLPDTVRRWPERHRDRWARWYRAVESHLIADAAVEARAILRAMLRHKRGQYRLSAAALILKSRDLDRALDRPPAPIEEEPDDANPLRLSEEETERALDEWHMSRNDQLLVDGAGI